MAKPTCAWLTVAFLAALSPTAVLSAGSNGTVFRSVAVGDCTATGPEKVCLTAPLVPGVATTTLDVLRDIYPGLRTDGFGHRFAGAEAVEAASDPDAGEPTDRAVDISTRDLADIAVIEAGGKAYAAAVSGGVVTMAEVKPAYRPLGRLLVATDPGGPTTGYRLLLAAPNSPVAVTLSSHFNSQEGFDAFHLVGAVGGALVDLYDGPYLYSEAEATERCELLDHREIVAVFETRKRKRHGLADIGIVVDYAATCINGEDSRTVGKKSFPIRLAYDGACYDGDTSRLDDFNAKFAE
ncbi:hypothetical protein [Pleomorphomonas sp. JP5]|uniref:hypothetical protein n=1 Tax=Pleomorphomonas sp. JP5 TaxID=2942998 RepID=UPI002043F140|nr:hypothetical protein [Pleomorphomonas sp. JP5]MCM5556533.1 hypothetical protein [Pleomorphomonas sp. JP5]